MEKYDIIVIGAGIVGLATAVKILELNASLRILILEKEKSIAQHQTGNNSGVIHSGIYYKPGSMKAQNCTRGYQLLLNFCRANDIKYDICGKIIVATSQEEVPRLENIFERGNNNGLVGLKKLSSSELKEIEPHVNGRAGIFVPQTGIIDYVQVSEKYLETIENRGGRIKYFEEVKNILYKNDSCEVITVNETFATKMVVTCAGLFSDRIAKMTHPELKVRIVPFRGEYYVLKETKRNLVKSLIYPVPDPAFPFLGVHFTRMINNEVECGPNAVLSFKREGYSKLSFNLRDTIDTFTWPGFYSVARKNLTMGLNEYYRSYVKGAFVKALQRLIPEIRKEDLIPGGSGVRAQACSKDGGLLDDFYFVEDRRVIHVCNAPSPAATASLSIGDFISRKVIDQLN